jgi:manganese transport protein
MAGFLRRHLPLLLRRGLTLAPALAVLVLGSDPTAALVWSQVVLSFGIPFALVPLVWLTSRRDLMGGWVNRRVTTLAGVAVAGLVSALNVHLLVDLVLG